MTFFKFNLRVKLQAWTVEQLYEFLRLNHEKGAFLWWGAFLLAVTHWWTGVCSFSLIFPFFIFLSFCVP